MKYMYIDLNQDKARIINADCLRDLFKLAFNRDINCGLEYPPIDEAFEGQLDTHYTNHLHQYVYNHFQNKHFKDRAPEVVIIDENLNRIITV